MAARKGVDVGLLLKIVATKIPAGIDVLVITHLQFMTHMNYCGWFRIKFNLFPGIPAPNAKNPILMLIALRIKNGPSKFPL